MLGAWLMLQLTGLLRIHNVCRALVLASKISKGQVAEDTRLSQAARLSKLQPLVCGIMLLRMYPSVCQYTEPLLTLNQAAACCHFLVTDSLVRSAAALLSNTCAELEL